MCNNTSRHALKYKRYCNTESRAKTLKKNSAKHIKVTERTEYVKTSKFLKQLRSLKECLKAEEILRNPKKETIRIDIRPEIHVFLLIATQILFL